MNILALGNRIKEIIRGFTEELGVKDVDIVLEIPSRMEYGELATSSAFKIAKLLGKRPLEIANDLRDYLIERKIEYIDEVSVAGSGYINFRLNRDHFFSDYFKEIIEDGLYPYRSMFGGRYFKIEYTSVNPNKALHIGHARNVILGSSLYKMLSKLGNKVHLINYIDDTGTQMADILIGFLKLGYSVDPPDNMPFDKYCGDIVYVKSVEAIEKSDELKEERRKFIKLIEEGDNPVAVFARMIAERVLKRQLETCWRLGARYDLLVWESDIIRNKLHMMLYDLIEKSSVLIKVKKGKYAGTVAIKVSDKDDFDVYNDEVVIRNDGTLTYVGKDLVFALWKMGLINMSFDIMEFTKQPDGTSVYTTVSQQTSLSYTPDECDLLFNVIGSEQKKPQNAIKKVIGDIYGEEYANKYLHYYYELVTLSKESAEKYFGITPESESVRMSGRKGIYFNVDDVLDRMVDVIQDLVKKNNPELNDDEVRSLSEKIAVSSLKYSILSIDRDKIIKFDIEKALDVTRESGAYILYSYARALSILRKYGDKPSGYRISFDSLNSNDFLLTRYMMLFPLYLHGAMRKYEIKPLVVYMYKLSKQFNEFYEKNPVLRAEDEVKEYRILLTYVFTKLLEMLSELTNIELVDRM